MKKNKKLLCTLAMNNYSAPKCKICCRTCETYDKCKDGKKCLNLPEKCGIAVTAEMQAAELRDKWGRKNGGKR